MSGARRGRVAALALHHVGPVHARIVDLEQHLAFAGRGDRPRRRLQPLGRAERLDLDRCHGFGQGRHCASSGWAFGDHATAFRAFARAHPFLIEGLQGLAVLLD